MEQNDNESIQESIGKDKNDYYSEDDFQDYAKFEQEQMQMEEYQVNYNEIQKRYPKARDYQIKAITMFSMQNTGIINIFCGLGKGFISPRILDYMMFKNGFKSILLVFPSENLMDQFESEFNSFREECKEIGQGPTREKMYLKAGHNEKTVKYLQGYFQKWRQNDDESHIESYMESDSEDVQIYSDSEEETQSVQKTIFVLSTYCSVHKVKDMYNDFDFVLLDECHHAFSKSTEFLQEREENILKLTATLHKEENVENVIFKYSMRDAINNGYLCDYQIICKIFEKSQMKEEQRFDFVIDYIDDLMNRYGLHRMIGYCRNISDKGKGKTNLQEMKGYDGQNQLQIKTIQGSDKDKGALFDWLRNTDNDKRCLMSVNTLKEGIDIKNCDSVLFWENKNSFIDIIQCIGRCMRKLDGKKMAYIVVPLFINKSDLELWNDEAVQKLVKTEFKKLAVICKELRKVDSFITEAGLFGKVKYETGIDMDIEECVKRIFQKNSDKFAQKIQQMDEWIQKNGRKFTFGTKDPVEKKIAYFYNTCQNNYKKGTQSMKIQENRQMFEQFMNKYKHLIDPEEDKFEYKIKQMDEWIQKNGRKFTNRAKDPVEKKIAYFYGTCQQNYKKGINTMKIQENKQMFEQFMDKYKNLLSPEEDKFVYKMKQMDEWIQENGRKFIHGAKDPTEKKIAHFYDRCQKNYKKDINTMKIQENKQIFEQFMDKHKNLLVLTGNKFALNIEQMDEWLQQNGRKFTQKAKDLIEKKVAAFYGTCQQNYKKGINTMKIQENKQMFEQFMDKYKYIFDSEEDKFEYKMKQMDEWIQKNGRKFKEGSKDLTEKKNASFYANCQKNYKKGIQAMKIQQNKQLFEQFNEKYKDLFLNFQKVDHVGQEAKESHYLIKWRNEKYPIIKEYFQINNVYPSTKEKVYTILNTSIKNYKSDSPNIDKQLFEELMDQFPILKDKVNNTKSETQEESKQETQLVPHPNSQQVPQSNSDRYADIHKHFEECKEYPKLKLNTLITNDANKYRENKTKAQLNRTEFENLFKRYPAIYDNPKFKDIRALIMPNTQENHEETKTINLVDQSDTQTLYDAQHLKSNPKTDKQTITFDSIIEYFKTTQTYPKGDKHTFIKKECDKYRENKPKGKQIRKDFENMYMDESCKPIRDKYPDLMIEQPQTQTQQMIEQPQTQIQKPIEIVQKSVQKPIEKPIQKPIEIIQKPVEIIQKPIEKPIEIIQKPVEKSIQQPVSKQSDTQLIDQFISNIQEELELELISEDYFKQNIKTFIIKQFKEKNITKEQYNAYKLKLNII